MSYELDAFNQLDLAGQLERDEQYLPSKAKDGIYSQRLKQFRAENPDPDPDFRAVPDFEQLWAQLEHHAAKLAKTDWSLMKATSSLGAKASELGITRLSTNDLQQLLDDAARKNRATAQPIGEGGIFRVKNTPWVVDGIFRHGLNLLTGQAGAAKSRLCGALAGAWINGKEDFMDRKLLGPKDIEDRHILIIGTDQNRGDWDLTLKDSGLARLYAVDEKTDERLIQLHHHVTLHTLEEGMRVDADGIALLRRWCDAHPNCGVIIDSLAACLPPGVDEDKASAARPVHAINDALGTCWAVLLHHNRKGAGKDRNIGVGAGRGSGAIDAAVSRVIGLGLIHKMEGGALVAQESDPRRELISTKRGGATLHLVVNSNDWSVEGTADELKRQERQQHLLSNLTEAQTDVLSVLEATDDWITTRDVVTGLGSDYGDGTGSKAAAVRRTLKRLETLELIESKRVGLERCYHQLNSSEPPLNRSEHPKVYLDCSNSSGVAAQGISPVQEPVQSCSEISSEPSEPPLNRSEHSEHSEQVPEPPEPISEPPSEPPKTQSQPYLNTLNTPTSEPPVQTPVQSCSKVRDESPVSQVSHLLVDIDPSPVAVGSGADVAGEADDPHWTKRSTEVADGSGFASDLKRVQARHAAQWEVAKADAKDAGCEPERVQRFKTRHKFPHGDRLSPGLLDLLQQEIEADQRTAKGEAIAQQQWLQRLKNRATPDCISQIAARLSGFSQDLIASAAFFDLKVAKVFLLEGLDAVGIKQRQRLVDGVWADLSSLVPCAVLVEKHLLSQRFIDGDDRLAARCMFWGAVIRLGGKEGDVPDAPDAFLEWCGYAAHQMQSQRDINRMFSNFSRTMQGKPSSESDRAMLGLPDQGQLTRKGINAAYKAQAKHHHPDAGGDPRKFQRLTEARDHLLLEVA